MASIFEYIAKLRFETDSKAKLGAVQDDLKKLKDNAHVPVSVDTGKAAADVQQNVRSVNEWKTKLKELKSERDKSEDPKKIQDLNEQIRIARDEVKNLEAPIKQTFDKETPEEFADAVEKVGKNAKAASSGNFDQLRNLFAGGAIAAGVKEAIQAGSAYQANVAELSAITGVGGAALDDLSNRARRAALEMGGSAQGNITAFKTILSRLGPDVAKTPAALDAMSRAVGTLSRATGDTAEASVDALTTSVLQFQVPLDDAAKAAGEMTRMMNVLAAGAKEGAAEVPQVAEAIKVAGVAASGAKVSFEETNAAIQALAAGGKIGAEAGTALRNVLGKLGEGRFLPKDVQAELKAANVDINKLGDTSLTLTERMRELQKIQGDAALMTKLFGTENSAAASILLRSVDSIDELKEKITGTNTATEQAAVRQATFAATMERVQAAIGDVAITFFDTISPALTAIAGAAGDVLGFLGQSKLAVGALGAALGTIAVFLAAGAVKQFFGTFLTGTIQSSLAILQKLIPSLVVQTATTGAATGAQLALNTAMLAGPWAIVAGAVAVAVGAYALFAANSENLAESTEDVNNALAEYNKATEDFVATEKSAERTRKLADEYDRLSKSTAPDDQKRLTDITKELDQATQGAGIAVDNYGNAIEANTERVRAFADEQLRLSDQMRQDAWQNMLDQAAELGGKYSEASEEAERLRLTIDRQRNVGENLAAKLNLANDLQENREELSQFAKEREAAEKALLPVLREMDRSLNGQLTAERVMAQFGVRKIEEANKLLALMRQQNAALTDQQQKSEEADKPKPRTKQTEQDLLALAKQKADAAAEALEVELRKARAMQGQAFSSRDELAVQQRRNRALDEEIQKRTLLTKDKYKIKAQLEIDKGTTKDLELTAKVRVETERARQDLDKALVDLAKTEITLGIRPQTDNLTLLEGQIDSTKKKLTDALGKVNLFAPDPKALQAVAVLQQQILQFEGEKSAAQEALNKRVSDARIALITDETQREIALRSQRLAEDLKFVRQALDAGRDLTADELQLQKLLTEKYYRDIGEIRKKAKRDQNKDEISIARSLHGSLLAFEKKFLEDRQKLSDAEFKDKMLGYENEEAALRASLDRGEVSHKEFNVKLAKLTEDRIKFEEEAEAARNGRMVDAANAALGAIGTAFDQFFQKLFDKYIQDEIFFKQTEEVKTQAALDGADQRAAASDKETSGSLLAAGAKMLSAVTEAIAKSIAFLGPLAGPVAGLATAAALMGAFRGFKSLLGFEHGGIRMGVVGERGPEIIGPTKDFSQMATSLVLETSRAVERGISRANQSTGSNGMSDMRVAVTGRLVSRGRDAFYQLEHERTARRRERLVSA